MSTSKTGKFYVQRDLEDQILEELNQSQSKNLVNNLETNHLKTKSMSTAPAKKTVSIKETLELLEKGYSRYTKGDKGQGSIQSHFGLTGSQVSDLFKHEKLKGRKTHSVSIEAIDDAPDVKPLVIAPKKPRADKATAAPAKTAPAAKVAASDDALFA